ncbi:MAG: hypothetical protein CSA49_04040 [Gammaproteobacteria bacterium]|nr:MAG: hypothetical protein CSA49_04040 [Gammaproteobacteria bacterium]
MELIETLISQLGIDEDQAKGGAGLLFKLAKDKLASGEFSQIVDKVPGVEDMMNAAPDAEGGAGGLMGSIGGMLGSLGGNAGALGNLASLAGGFDKLGLDNSMVSKFIPIVIQFVQEKGGDDLMALLQKVISGDS